MKKYLLCFIPILAAAVSCEDFMGPSGETGGRLYWHLDKAIATKAKEEIPDTNDFILTITGPGGNILYDGAYGDSPAFLDVSPGAYTLDIASITFTAPGFEKPLYGDSKTVYVGSGASIAVKLECTMQNSGIRVRRDQGFSSGIILLKQGSSRLIYGFTEKRTAYFFPGDVSVVLSENSVETPLFTRTLAKREVLTVNLYGSSGTDASQYGTRVEVDTCKVWKDFDWTVGSGGSEEDHPANDAIGVADAASHAGENGVWVYGYIVGGDLTTAGASVKTSGITKATHLAIAARSSISDKSSCVAVELPSGKVREGINLVDHPDLIGRRVYVKGNVVESYFGTTGLKGTGEYVLK